MKAMLIFFVCVCLNTLLFFSANAYAWGAKGHRITGFIAYELLSPQARAGVRYYLDSDNLAAAAEWMDENRSALGQQFPSSSTWHYDNLGLCRSSTHEEYCANGNCASSQIEEFSKILSNNQASKEERTLALRLLIHMLGDIHQPLHAANNDDLGGNRISVKVNGRYTNLHAAWDTTLVSAISHGMSAQQFAQSLSATYRTQFGAWSQGRLQNWINESHQLAVEKVYAPLSGFSCLAHTSGR